MQFSASRRQVLALALAASVAGGIGYGAYTLGSAAGTDTVTFARAGSTTATTTTTGATPSAEASEASPLTLDEATALAMEAAPGTVIEWDEDLEPSGLRYDVKVLHTDGTTTDVEVDTVTGLITSIDHDDDRD